MSLTARTSWPETYRRGSHCFSTMLSNVFEGTGFDLDEELCFVIGGGFGFLFHREESTSYVNARMHDLEHFFARRTGSRIEFVSHPDADAMTERARDWSEQGLLPYLYCEARELPSFAGVLPWDEVHAFGEHALPVRTVLPNGDLICNDYLWSTPLPVSAASAAAAASMPSDGSLLMAAPARKFAVGRIVPPRLVPDLDEVLTVSLAESAELFLNPANNTQGERALKALERELSSMSDVLTTQQIRRELLSISTMLEKIGTGGGAGRHLFSRGLRASARHLGHGDLDAVADRYASLGRGWRAFASALRAHARAEDPREGWGDLVSRMRELRRAELEAVSRLSSLATSLLRGTS
ncbi:DUF4872 domain-containing protein [Pseudoclavibacter sp. VKM Ac-2867]|uniref:DUF4872 domain-containing protein n=1 Tax=Pseudoclavibacter sp. VKM Ac-2867 TaxID=2783829 RepID=UPI001889D931|nr:DUF4872 domain-containing protein [Pseudoclavibacter sp. VKM Ac-2867]MBF4457719.1 DUF4872 domain-containing protein [Pseudoclavibacter sp. VKM Ac-2867]